MKPSPDLFDLIKSLSPAEKRYFKLFASLNNKKGVNAYERVFDAIEKQKEYDEEAVINETGGEKMARQFPVVKNYLFKLILKSLRNYHSGQSVDFRLKETMMNVEILLRKDLIPQCLKQLEKARKTAIEYEKYEYFMEILNYNISLAVKVSELDLDKLDEHLETLFLEADSYFEKFKNILTHKKLAMQMLVLNRKEQHLRSESSLKAYTSLMDHPITRGIGSTRSVKARAYYLQSLYIFHFARGDYKEGFQAGLKMVELMEENPFLVEERPENYLTALTNLVTMSIPVNPPEESLKYIERLKAFDKRFPRIRFDKAVYPKALLFAYHQQLSIYLIRKDYASGMKLEKEIREWEAKSSLKFNLNEGFVLLGIYFNLAKLFLYGEQYRESLRYIKQILDHPGISNGYWMYLTARLLQVILYAELKEDSLLDSASISFYRFLEKKKQLHRFEKVLMKYLRKGGCFHPDHPDYLEYLKGMKSEVEEAIEKDPFEQNALQQFDFLEWLSEKISAVG